MGKCSIRSPCAVWPSVAEGWYPMRVPMTLVMILSAAFADAADVLVSVRGVANDRGEIVVGICSADMFIGGTCAYRGTAPVRPGTVSVMVSGVVPRTYAVPAYHDENGNHRIDRNLSGIHSPWSAMVLETTRASSLPSQASPMPRSRWGRVGRRRDRRCVIDGHGEAPGPLSAMRASFSGCASASATAVGS